MTNSGFARFRSHLEPGFWELKDMVLSGWSATWKHSVVRLCRDGVDCASQSVPVTSATGSARRLTVYVCRVMYRLPKLFPGRFFPRSFWRRLHQATPLHSNFSVRCRPGRWDPLRRPVWGPPWSVQKADSPEPELVTGQSPICVSRGKCRRTGRKVLRLPPSTPLTG